MLIPANIENSLTYLGNNQLPKFSEITPQNLVNYQTNLTSKVSIEDLNANLQSMFSLSDEDITFQNTIQSINDMLRMPFLAHKIVALLSLVREDKWKNDKTVIPSYVTSISNIVENNINNTKGYQTLVLSLFIHSPLNLTQQKITVEMITSFQKQVSRLNDENKKRYNDIQQEINIIKRKILSDLKLYNDSTPNFSSLIDDDSHTRQFAYTENIKCIFECTLGKNADSKECKNLITKVIEMKQQQATLLNFKSYMHLILQDYAINNPRQAVNLLISLLKISQTHPTIKNYNQLMDNFARSKNINSRQAWDNKYLLAEILKTPAYSVDIEKQKQYFNLSKVMQEIYSFLESNFNIKFKQKDADVWHTDVTYYEIVDKNNQNIIIGRLYLDIFARDNKQKLNSHYNLLNRSKDVNDFSYIPISVLLFNFEKSPTQDETYISHQQIIDFIEQIGRSLNDLLCKTEYENSAGMNIENDAIYANRLVFQHLAWEYDFIKKLSCHQYTREVLPEEMFNKMLASRNLKVLDDILTTAPLALLDIYEHLKPALNIENQQEKDLIDNFNSLDLNKEDNLAKVLPLILQNDESLNNPSQLNYIHLMHKILGADMFKQIKGNNNLNNWDKYKTQVLELGSSIRYMNMFQNFTGRKLPDINALFDVYSFINPETKMTT